MTQTSAPLSEETTSLPANRPPRRPARAGRNRRSGSAASAAAQPAMRAPAKPLHPVLQQLQAWYPKLFGEAVLPLKRGIFNDLLAAHEAELDRDALKAGLALHTRSTRYLSAVASGLARHDLQGQAVEPMAPEHVLHALLEVFRRRQARSAEDLSPKLRQRIGVAFEASGLSREAYAALLHSRDAAVQTLFDEALSDAAARVAKDEALHRAYSSSGLAPEAFADSYGLPLGEVKRMLARIQRRLD